jgi:hypothetical protein
MTRKTTRHRDGQRALLVVVVMVLLVLVLVLVLVLLVLGWCLC